MDRKLAQAPVFKIYFFLYKLGSSITTHQKGNNYALKLSKNHYQNCEIDFGDILVINMCHKYFGNYLQNKKQNK